MAASRTACLNTKFKDFQIGLFKELHDSFQGPLWGVNSFLTICVYDSIERVNQSNRTDINHMLFKAFHSIIQGRFKAFFQSIILWHTTLLVLEEKRHIDLKHSCMTFINNKQSKQFCYPLNSNCGRKFLLKVSHRQIPNFSRPSTRFPKQFKDIFSFMKFKDFSRLFLNSRPAQ